jgi:hypothetical protein
MQRVLKSAKSSQEMIKFSSSRSVVIQKAQPIRLLCFTWNVGNKQPLEEQLQHWLPEGGENLDLVAVGTQENSFKTGNPKAGKQKSSKLESDREESDPDDDEKIEEMMVRSRAFSSSTELAAMGEGSPGGGSRRGRPRGPSESVTEGAPSFKKDTTSVAVWDDMLLRRCAGALIQADPS